MNTPEPTTLTMRDREELAHTAGLLSGIARLAASTPLADLNRDGLLDGLQRAVAGIDGVLARDLARRGGGMSAPEPDHDARERTCRAVAELIFNRFSAYSGDHYARMRDKAGRGYAYVDLNDDEQATLIALAQDAVERWEQDA